MNFFDKLAEKLKEINTAVQSTAATIGKPGADAGAYLRNVAQNTPSFMSRVANGLSGLSSQVNNSIPIQTVRGLPQASSDYINQLVNDKRTILPYANTSQDTNLAEIGGKKLYNFGAGIFNNIANEGIIKPTYDLGTGLAMNSMNQPINSSSFKSGVFRTGADLAGGGVNLQNTLGDVGQAVTPILNAYGGGKLFGYGGEAVNGVEKTFPQLVSQSSKVMGNVGGLFGLAQGAQDNKNSNMGDFLKNTGISGIQGYASGRILGAVMPYAGREIGQILGDVKSKLNPKVVKTIVADIKGQTLDLPTIRDLTEKWNQTSGLGYNAQELDDWAKSIFDKAPKTTISTQVPFEPKSLTGKLLQKTEGKQPGMSIEDVSGGKPPLQEGGKTMPKEGSVSSDAGKSGELPQTTELPNKGVPQENPALGQTVPDTSDNKLPPINDSYNNDVAQDNTNVKPKGFVNTLLNSDKATTPMIQAADTMSKDYTPIPQNVSEANAEKFITENGIDNAHQAFIAKTPWSADKTKIGDALINKYAETGQMDKLGEIISSYDEQARQAGQGNAAIAGWASMKPKAVLSVFDNMADKLKQPLSDDFRTQIINRANAIQQMAKNSPERLQATQSLIEDVAKQLPNNWMENFKAYRFQNMLSNPITLGKIGYSGLFNTLVTHPVDMVAEATTQGAKRLMNSDFQRSVFYSDIPQWYKNVLIGIPDAWNAAIQGFQKGTIDKALSDGVSGETALQIARNQNTPKFLSFFPKLHSFIYSYGQSIISGAEYARMMDNGATEVEAKAAAVKLADKLTMRSQLGEKDQAAIVRAVDSMGKMITNSSKMQGVGWAQSWVAPFMKVSTNWTKLAVEHSPLALPDTAWKMLKGGNADADAAFAHAMVGSMVTGIGASMAMNGRITLSAPTDKTQSDLFYASGRKPYSVKVFDKWVPMQYFGPFGFSMMLPEAIKEAVTGTNAPKDAFTKVEQAVSKTTKMIISTTPLPTISQFIDVLNGTSGVNPATVAAGLAGQVIPLDSMVRYISGLVDPIYRKASTFGERIESGIPELSKNLPAYTNPMGEPETRNATNYVAPYGIGQEDNRFEGAYQQRQQVLNSNAIIKQQTQDAQSASATGQSTNPSVHPLPDGTFSYQKQDGSFAKAKTQEQAELEITKDKMLNNEDDKVEVSNNYILSKDDYGNIKTIKNTVPITQQDAEKLVDMDKKGFTLNQETLSAYNAYKEIMKTPSAQANSLMDEMQKSNPKEYKMLSKIRDYDQLGFDSTKLAGLSKTNGEMANAIVTYLKSLPENKAQSSFEMLRQRGYVTKTVYKQMLQIRNGK